MKTKSLAVSVIFATMLFASCGEREGIYNPERKLVMVETTKTTVREVRDNPTDEWEFYDSNSYVHSEIWTWNGDKLDNIRFFANGSTDAEQLDFEYDGDRIKRIEEQNRELRVEVGYDGRKVKTISLFEHNVEVATATFSHKRGKVSSIEERILGYMCAKDKELFGRIIGVVIDSDPVSLITENVEYAEETAKSDLFYEYEWVDFEWDGDNIESANNYHGDRNKVYSTCEYTYDNANNPYAGMTYGGVDGSFVEQTTQLNANNVVSKKTTYKSGNSSVQEFTYTYDNNWPLSKTNVDVESYYLPSTKEYNQVTTTTVTRFTYQDND